MVCLLDKGYTMQHVYKNFLMAIIIHVMSRHGVFKFQDFIIIVANVCTIILDVIYF